MRRHATGKQALQVALRTALGPGTRQIGVTEAILQVVACSRFKVAEQRPVRYCTSDRGAERDPLHVV